MSGSKRKSIDSADTTSEKRVRLADDVIVRRSNRHHKARGEKEINVAANQTLWDLKIKVCHYYRN